MLEALQIVSGSWPIAAMGIVLFAAIGINMVVRRVSKANAISENRQISKELEIERMKQRVITLNKPGQARDN